MNDGACARGDCIKWVRASLTPLTSLAPLGEMIGDATLVAFGEGVHEAAEPLELRNRVFQYLVREKGFTAIGIESGLVESREVHDYVRGAPGDLHDVMSLGLTWTFDSLSQNHDLVRWLKAHNDSPGCARKVDFYGFDVSGSPGDPSAVRGVETALLAALQYLDDVDHTAAASFRNRFAPFFPKLRFNYDGPVEGPGYHELSLAERNLVSLAIEDLGTFLGLSRVQYESVSSADDYEWASRAQLAALQVDAMSRQLPFEWNAKEAQRFLDAASDLRDCAQAQNIDWIFRRAGADGKVLVFAHNAHLSTTPVEPAGWIFPAGAVRHQPAGVHLRRGFGANLVAIGNLIGQEQTGNPIGAFFAEVAVPRFILDLRNAPAHVAAWLARIGLDTAFDVLVYLDVVTPARPTFA